MEHRNAAEIAAEHGGKKVGDRYRLACPAHGGTGPNLAIWDGDRPGRIGAVCHSRGCDYGDILDALGVAHELPDHRGEPHHVTTYYTAAGEPRPVYRTDGPGGKRVWGEGSPVGTLVKLWPCAGADATEPVVLCEGEKAAAAVQGAGWTAASWRGGTGTVASVDFAPLATRDVILWPDADPQGRKAMETAAAALRAHRCRIVTLEAPGDDGSDAADVAADDVRARLEAIDWQDAEPAVGTRARPPGETHRRLLADGDPWDRHNQGADAMAARVMLYWSDRLLAVEAQPMGEWELLAAAAGGTWARDTGEIRRYIDSTANAWAHDILDDRSIEKPASMVTRALSYTRRSPQEDLLAQVGAAWLEMKAQEALPDALSYATLDALDPVGRYVGAPNGVIDLDTGELLTGDAARRLCLTRRVGAPFDPALAEDAHRHPLADKLFAILGEAEREWLLGATGYALRGLPSRRIYVLLGPPGGGKSALVKVLHAVFGEYSAELSPAAVSAKAVGEARSVTPEFAPLVERRIATVSEPRATLSAKLLKAVSGGDEIVYRPPYGAETRGPGAATVIIVGNDGHLGRLPLEDAALMERVRVLRMETIANPEPNLAERILADPDALASVLAMVVSASVRHPQPPEDVPSVTQARASLRSEMLGDAGVWLSSALVGELGAKLATDALWDAAKRAAPGDGDPWGINRRQLTALARDIYGLPSAVRARGVGGKPSRVWHGWRLATDEEVGEAVAREEQAALVLADEHGPVTYAGPGTPELDVSGLPADVARRIRDDFERQGWSVHPGGAVMHAPEADVLALGEDDLDAGEPYSLAKHYEQAGRLAGEPAPPPPLPDAVCRLCEPPPQTFTGRGAIRKLREHLQHAHGLPFDEALELAVQEKGEPDDD